MICTIPTSTPLKVIVHDVSVGDHRSGRVWKGTLTIPPPGLYKDFIHTLNMVDLTYAPKPPNEGWGEWMKKFFTEREWEQFKKTGAFHHSNGDFERISIKLEDNG
jgi:hypothetical protein